MRHLFAINLKYFVLNLVFCIAAFGIFKANFGWFAFLPTLLKGIFYTLFNVGVIFSLNFCFEALLTTIIKKQKYSSIVRAFLQLPYTFTMAFIAIASYVSIDGWRFPIKLPIILHNSLLISQQIHQNIGAVGLFLFVLYFNYFFIDKQYPHSYSLSQNLKISTVLLSFLTVIQLFVYKINFRDANAVRRLSYLPFQSIIYWGLFDENKDIIQAKKIAYQSLKVPPFKNKKNVILITIDDLRGDYADLFPISPLPFLDSLQQLPNVTAIPYAFSGGNTTLFGMPNILLSEYTKQNDYNKVIKQSVSIAEVFKKNNYHYTCFLSGDHHNWYYLFSLYAPYCADYFCDGTSQLQINAGFRFSEDDRNSDDKILQQLKQYPNFHTPNFITIHLLGAHQLNNSSNELTPAFQKTGIKKDRIWYFNNLLKMNTILRNLFTILNEKKLLENTLIVITADHGESFGEYNKVYNHGSSFSPYETRIPLLFWSSDNSLQLKNKHFATNLDIAPTIIRYLGGEIPAKWKGHSLIDTEFKPFSFKQTSPNHQYDANFKVLDSFNIAVQEQDKTTYQLNLK